MVDDVNRIISSLIPILKIQNRQKEIDLLMDEKVELIETGFDSWNGGIEYFSLYIYVSPQKYALLLDEIDQIEKVICEGLTLILRSYDNYGIEKVRIISNFGIEPSHDISEENRAHLIELLTQQKSLMIAVSTGGPKINDWAAFSHAKGTSFSETGNYARFILQDRTDIIETNQSSLPAEYKDGLTDDEIYVNLMSDKFLTMVVHESLHGEHAHDYPQLFWDENASYRARLEHVNIYTIQHEVAERIGSTDEYVDWLSQVVQLQRDYLIDQGFTEERMDAVQAYREF